MSTAIRVSDDLVKKAKKYSKVEKRTIPLQIEHWAKIGKIAEDNPGLTYSFIKEILLGMEDINEGEKSSYEFG